MDTAILTHFQHCTIQLIIVNVPVITATGIYLFALNGRATLCHHVVGLSTTASSSARFLGGGMNGRDGRGVIIVMHQNSSYRNIMSNHQFSGTPLVADVRSTADRGFKRDRNFLSESRSPSSFQ